MIFGARSISRMAGLHPDLKKIMDQAILTTDLDFTILEGVRTLERQKQMVESGASTTLNSRHLDGHAVDIAPFVGGEVRWDWPLYYKLAVIVKAAAKTVNVPIEWGGDWKTLKDGPHWQLPWAKYP